MNKTIYRHCECREAISSFRSPRTQAPSRRRIFYLFVVSLLLLFISCAEPVEPGDTTGPTIPSIDSDANISIVTWNIEKFPQLGSRTTSRVELIIDSLDADFYLLQEIQDKGALEDIVDQLERYSVIISDETSFMHLAIVYKQDHFLATDVKNPFSSNDYNFAGRPPLWVSFAYELEGKEQVLNLIDVHMKCCEKYPSDLERRHDASRMLHDYLDSAVAGGDSNFVVLGDWNDDIYDPDSSGQYAFEAFLNDRENYYFVTDSLASTRSARNASFPSWPSFLDNILITRSLFDEFEASKVQTLRLDEIFGDYSSVVSDHRPVLWSYRPN